ASYDATSDRAWCIATDYRFVRRAAVRERESRWAYQRARCITETEARGRHDTRRCSNLCCRYVSVFQPQNVLDTIPSRHGEGRRRASAFRRRRNRCATSSAARLAAELVRMALCDAGAGGGWATRDRPRPARDG